MIIFLISLLYVSDNNEIKKTNTLKEIQENQNKEIKSILEKTKKRNNILKKEIKKRQVK